VNSGEPKIDTSRVGALPRFSDGVFWERAGRKRSVIRQSLLRSGGGKVGWGSLCYGCVVGRQARGRTRGKQFLGAVGEERMGEETQQTNQKREGQLKYNRSEKGPASLSDKEL